MNNIVMLARRLWLVICRGRIAALAGLMTMASTAAGAVDFSRDMQFDIGPQALATALVQFSTQADVQFTAPGSSLAGVETKGIKGEYPTNQALSLLLRGTGFTFRVVDDNTVAIHLDGAAVRSTASPRDPIVGTDTSSSLRIARADDPPATSRRSATDAKGETRILDEGEEVIVTGRRATTATKTDTALVDTPQAISVITADQFIDRGALLYEETLRYSSSVNPEAFGSDPRLSNAVVRGFGATNYVDRLRSGFGFANFARIDVYALERVEVLRGPSSTLYGAGGAGGLINHVSKRPEFSPEMRLGLQYGNHDRKQFQFDLTGPLGSSENFAARLVGVAREAGTQVDHVSDDRVFLMPSMTWRVTEDTSMTVIGTWIRDRLGLLPQYHPLKASILAGPGKRLPDSFFGGEPGFDRFDVDERSITLLAEHRFSDALSFGSSARYVSSRNALDIHFVDAFTDQDPLVPGMDPFIDEASGLVPRYVIRDDQRPKAFTIDNRLRFDVASGKLSHSFLVGVDYQRFTQTGHNGFGANVPLDIYEPVYGNLPDVQKLPVPDQSLSQLGFYAQDQIEYADRTHIVLGVRRDRSAARTEPDPEQVDHATTFRAAVIVDVWNGLSPYVSFAESFLPVAGFSSFNQDPFVPQEGKMYEAGIKWQPQPHTLMTLAAFDIREQNRFTNHPSDPTLLVQQGEVRSRGVELEASHRLFGNLDISATYTFVNAEVSESNAPAEVGLQLDTTPEHQATLWTMSRFDLANASSLRVGAGVRYMGEHFSSGVLRIPSYTLADALLSLDWQQWSVSLNASNLFDKRHYATCLARGDCYPGVRRNVVGTLNYRF